MESNIDDCSGEILGYTMELLLNNKALDVFYTSIQMKKNRPAYKLSVICKESDKDLLSEIIFKQTTTIGIRTYKVDRICMDRSFESVDTIYGNVDVKVAKYNNIKKVYPEYEDLKKIANKNDLSLSYLYDLVKNSI